MTFENFIANSKAIFEAFPNEQVWLQGGFRANRQIGMPEAGYCVVLRYDQNVTDLIANYMKKIFAILPPVVEYDAQSLHTTIGVFEKGAVKGFAPDSEVLKRLGKSVKTGLRNNPGNPAVTFERWLYNQEAMLISGYPNLDLWYLMQKIGEACQENGVPLERGHIMHITTARFTRGVSRPVFEQFLRLMDSAPIIGTTKPSAIDVATWQCDGLMFDLVTHDQYLI